MLLSLLSSGAVEDFLGHITSVLLIWSSCLSHFYVCDLAGLSQCCASSLSLCRYSPRCRWPSALGETSSSPAAEVKPPVWMLLPRLQTTDLFPCLRPRQSFQEGSWALSTCSRCCAYHPLTPWILWVGGGEWKAGSVTLGWCHHNGLKLILGSAPEGCVHEVTSLKPKWWAVTEHLSNQFSVIFLSSVGFLSFILGCLTLIIFFCFLHGVNNTRDEE